MYSVRFVPIVEKENEVFDHNEEILERRSQNSELVHVLRTTRFCWCDLDALATLNRGIMYPFYVIEVEVEGWNGNDTRNKDLLSHVSILYYPMYHMLLSLKSLNVFWDAIVMHSIFIFSHQKGTSIQYLLPRTAMFI